MAAENGRSPSFPSFSATATAASWESIGRPLRLLPLEPPRVEPLLPRVRLDCAARHQISPPTSLSSGPTNTARLLVPVPSPTARHLFQPTPRALVPGSILCCPFHLDPFRSDHPIDTTQHPARGHAGPQLPCVVLHTSSTHAVPPWFFTPSHASEPTPKGRWIHEKCVPSIRLHAESAERNTSSMWPFVTTTTRLWSSAPTESPMPAWK